MWQWPSLDSSGDGRSSWFRFLLLLPDVRAWSEYRCYSKHPNTRSIHHPPHRYYGTGGAGMSGTKHTPAPWQEGKCRVPMWVAGLPSGHCGERAFGHQLPMSMLSQERGWSMQDRPYCFGHCCKMHGGTAEGDPIIFQDGLTEQGRPMWCAVMPGFINLQESPAGFSGNPFEAIALLRAALSKAGD